jgi:anion-transporting  ArsA/GET3 family ATPase
MRKVKHAADTHHTQTETEAHGLDHLLLTNKVVVCAGSGGVGKTTMSAAIAVRAAQLGRRTLVLTVDPAKRLATALGLDLKSDEERAVKLTAPSRASSEGGSLSAAMIDSKKTFDQFIATHARQPSVAERIMKNRLYQQLSTTLSGSQEFTALERLLQAVESGRYDLVVLDTPPTKHAMDFLTAPQRINALFQDAITRWFMSPNEKSTGLFATLVGRGTRVALRSLEVLTGSQFIEELIDFFSAVRSIQQVLRDRSAAVHSLLTGPSTKFVMVTSFDAAKLLEAKYLQGELRRLGYTMQAVIINRAFPQWLPSEIDAPVDPAEREVFDKVLKYQSEFKNYYSARYNLYEHFAKGLGSSVALLRVPEYQQDVYGLNDLEALADVLGGKPA